MKRGNHPRPDWTDSTADALLNLDFDLIHQISGPVAIRGAEPGDTLVVDIVEVKPKGWGYSFVLPGFNLLKDDPAFQTPFLMHWDLTGGGTAEFKPGILVPFEPFCGVMGLAPGRARRAQHGAATQGRR